MHRKLLILGSLSGFLAVILGSFASHGLEKLLTIEAVATFQVGVRYQFYHALLALLCANIAGLSQKTNTVLFYILIVLYILLM